MTLTEQIGRATAKVVTTLLGPNVRTATCYLDPGLTVRGSHVRYNKKIRARMPHHVVLTIGRPNARARQFIKEATRTGEPFPIKKVQILPAVRLR